ncbi:hypothetical protein BLOT_005025 [Blomia tropicalis]|nr:hypothetical protein BLOT_005025 [Blomia tropicalis]
MLTLKSKEGEMKNEQITSLCHFVTFASHVHIYLLNGYHRFYVHLYVDMDQCVLNSPLGHSTLLDKVLMEHLMSTSMIR